MAFSELELQRIKRVVGEFVEGRRPRPEIRNQLDIVYSIDGQSVLIQEDRLSYDGSRILEPVVKTTWVKSQRIWKIFWMRADLKWHRYDPLPQVRTLEEFVAEVDANPCCCFWG